MLKDDLEKIIGSFLIDGEGIDEGEVAQTIVDKLEIDEEKVIKALEKFKWLDDEALINLAEVIAKAKPIKLKERMK